MNELCHFLCLKVQQITHTHTHTHTHIYIYIYISIYIHKYREGGWGTIATLIVTFLKPVREIKYCFREYFWKHDQQNE